MEDVIDLALNEQISLLEVARQLSDYEKMQAFIVLKALRLPTLDGIVVRDWRRGTKNRIEDALEKRGWDTALLRSDCRRGAYRKPRGGHLYSAKCVYAAIRSVIRDRRVAAVLEPVSRFDDLYSGNVWFDHSCDYLYWEIVGPGFDMSDINRGDLNPHETFRTCRGQHVQDWQHLSPLDIRGRSVISPEDYRRSWNDRLRKVGMMAPRDYWYIGDPLERASVFLRETDHTLLLESEDRYRPMEYEMRCKIYNLIADLPRKLKRYGFHGEPFAVSFGVLQERGLIFWDIFYPFTYSKT